MGVEEEGEDKGTDGWELYEARAVEGGDAASAAAGQDLSYLNEKDATDVSVLNVCSEGTIRHPPAAVLKVSACLCLCGGAVSLRVPEILSFFLYLQRTPLRLISLTANAACHPV